MVGQAQFQPDNNCWAQLGPAQVGSAQAKTKLDPIKETRKLGKPGYAHVKPELPEQYPT